MSRIGKLPIKIPNEITVNIEGNVVHLKKGNVEKHYDVGDKIIAVLEDGMLKVKIKDSKQKAKVRNLLGLHRSNLNNIVQGLIEDFSEILELYGVGYKATVSGKFLVMSLGYSHDIAYFIPEGIKMKVEKNLVTVSGNDKAQVGQVVSELVKFRKPEPYKGKGVRIKGVPILRKEGKKK